MAVGSAPRGRPPVVSSTCNSPRSATIKDELIRSSGDEYAAAIEARQASMRRSGHDPHGEASFVESLDVHRVLDAGCGTGRVARELDRRGCKVFGVDVDPAMVATAKRVPSGVSWRVHDLATLPQDDPFDAVLLAGNVMLFLAPGSEAQVISAMAAQLRARGLLVAGFQLGLGLTAVTYDMLCTAAGLTTVERWSTWERAPEKPTSRYLVAVHRKSP